MSKLLKINYESIGPLNKNQTEYSLNFRDPLFLSQFFYPIMRIASEFWRLLLYKS